jgi:Ca-activated chloride channel homolog
MPAARPGARSRLRISAALALVSASGLACARDLRADTVPLELVLAVDASDSIGEGVLEFQLRGHAAAFRDRRVVEAIEAAGGAVAVTLTRWSGPNTLEVLVPWTRIADAGDARAFSAAIDAVSREGPGGNTDIGNAIDRAADLFDGNGFDAPRRVIDICSNGFDNAGPRPEPARDRAVAAGITINGLVMLDEYFWLESYFQEKVIGGPGSFVEAAADEQSFAAALVRKFVLEIAGRPSPGSGT